MTHPCIKGSPLKFRDVERLVGICFTVEVIICGHNIFPEVRIRTVKALRVRVEPVRSGMNLCKYQRWEEIAYP